jgi:hypothetical protein
MATKTEGKLSGNNLIIVLALVTFLAVGVTALVAKALVASIVLDTKVVSAKSLADKNLKTDLEAAPKLVDAYNALGAQANVLADALPNTADFPSLIVELENISGITGVKIKSVSPSLTGAATTGDPAAGTAPATTAGEVPTPQTYSYTVTFDGTYASLVGVLGSLETSARPMRVVGLQATGTGGALSVELDVDTFYMDKAQLPIGKETIK